MRSFLLPVFISCMLLVLATTGFTQPGTIDRDFGKNGKVLASLGNGNDYSESVLVQYDGKILVVGHSADSTGLNNFSLIRFNEDGSPDTTFGRKGGVRTDIKDGNDIAYAVAVQSDGKILVAGTTGTKGGQDGDFVIVRYDHDGGVDKTFGKRGKVLTDLGGDDVAYAIQQQSDGKIVVGGTSNNQGGNKNDFVLILLNTDGSTDNTFGSNGTVRTDFGGTNDIGKSMVIGSDDKILFAGTKAYGSASADFVVVQYTADGVIDNSFGTNGIVTKDFSGTADYAGALVLQPDGRIIVAGTSDALGTPGIGLVRYNEDGSADNTFGVNGASNPGISGYSLLSGGVSAGLSSEGKIIVLAQDSREKMLVARYNGDGTVDNSFGTSGATVFGGKKLKIMPSAMAVQADDKIVITGTSRKLGAEYTKIITARINEDIALPITLSYFTASKQPTSILLNWATTSEQGNDYFGIERSPDDNNFSEIATVRGKGYGTSLQTYAYNDNKPLPGANYYRLRQVDKDGNVSYTKTVYVNFGVTIVMRAYPNPAKDYLTIDGLNTGIKTSVSVMTMQGQTVLTGVTTADRYQVEVKGLAAGMYYVRIESGSKVAMLKFIKE